MQPRHGPILVLLTTLFFFRVAGQALVALGSVGWLPAMEHWSSGLLPYPALLAIQIVMLFVMVKISTDIWRGKGFFAKPRPSRARPPRLQRDLRRQHGASLCLDHDLPSGNALARRHDPDLFSLRAGRFHLSMG